MKKEKPNVEITESEMSFDDYFLKHFIIMDGENKRIKIFLRNLISMESRNNYLIVNSVGREPMKIRGVLKDWIEKLREPHFIEGTTAFLFNRYHILDFTSMGGGEVTLTGEVKANVAKNKHQMIIDYLDKDALFVVKKVDDKDKKKK